MHFTRKTYFGVGLVGAASNALASILLLVGVNMGLLYHVGTVASAAMMLFLATRYTEGIYRGTGVAGALLTICGWLSGAPGLVCAALGWPVFAIPYYTREPEESLCRKAAMLVFLVGAVQLVGSFVAMPDKVRICLAVGIAVTQGALAWVLFQREESAI